MKVVLKSLMVLALATGASACSGSSNVPKGAAMSAPAGAPDWVMRGSRVQSGSIFGLGSVAGIKNTAHARNTAGNRARKEISKILETYSASLMKDYAASTSAGSAGASSEEQSVEEAVKTFSAQLLVGVEVKDYWIDQGKGVWYALAELNFERQAEVAAAQAKMGPGMKAWFEANGGRVLGEVGGSVGEQGPGEAEEASEEEVAEAPAAGEEEAEEEAPAAPVRPAAPPAAPPVADGPPAKVGGPAPGWTQGQCDRARYLCGVGDGSDRKVADADARAELARIFTANVKSVEESFQGAAGQISSRTGESWIEVSKVSSYSLVSTDKVLTASQIVERWSDGNGRSWSLAVIDRAQAAAALRERIESLDGQVASRVSAAKASADGVARLKNLKAAVLALVEREALNADLRVVQADGAGVTSPHRMGDLVGMLDSAAGALSFGVAIGGSGAERVRACIEEALTAKGYQIEANVDEEDEEIDIEGSFDVIVKGSVKAEKRGQIAGSEVVQTTLTLKLINGKTQKVLRTLTGSEKGSRGSVKEAASTAAFKICQKKVPEMVSDIDKYFTR
jgi:hypothetical protein